jgi:Dolichyl-phosphate-mannose-protein mannosyltransferase
VSPLTSGGRSADERAEVSRNLLGRRPGDAASTGSSRRRVLEWASGPRGEWVVDLTAVAILSVALPLVIVWHFGALGIPRNDDWAFTRILFSWTSTGHLQLLDWNTQTLVGQLAIAVPVVKVFGTRIGALQAWVAVLGGAGCCCLYALLRRLLPRASALAALACLLVGPIYASLAGSFMSDVPAFAAASGCLWAGVVAIERRGWSFVGWLGASAVLGFLALSIRQVAATAPVAVALALFVVLRRGRRPEGSARTHVIEWRASVAIATVFTVGTAALLVWRSGLPFSNSIRLSLNPAFGRHASYLYEALFTLALLSLPAALRLSPTAVLRRALAVSRTATFVVLAGWGIVVGSALYLSRTAKIDLLLGNYVTRQGTVGVLAGRRPDLLPDAAWTALIVASLYATLMLALVVVTRFPAVRRAARAFRDGFTVDRANTAGLVLGGFGLLYLAALELALGFTQVVPTGHVAPAFSQTPYDRYLIPLVPIVVVLAWSDPSLFWAVPRVRRVVTAAGFGLFAVLGLAYVIESAAYDGARWAAAAQVARSGVPAASIDGGAEWVGFHARTAAIRHSGPSPTSWASMFRDVRTCYLISVEPHYTRHGATGPIATFRYRGWHPSPQTLSLYRLPTCNADPRTAPAR